MAECYSREGGERERRWPPPEDLRSRNRRDRHRLDLDVGAGLISVDFHEHVADAQGRAVVMGDDDLHLLRRDDPTFSMSAHHRGRTIDVAGWIGYTFGIEVIDYKLSRRHPASGDMPSVIFRSR